MSTRYNTGNPIESTDVRDMSDNAKNLDLFSNSSELSFDDRFGVERKTIHGMNSEFDAQILNMGFTIAGTFLSGATLTNPRQTLLWDIADGGDGQEYGWSGTFPKIVPPGRTPSSTGGIAVGAWMSRFDPELRIMVRESMRRSYAEAGYNLLGTFRLGVTLNTATDAILDESTGIVYSWGGVLPHTVAPGTNPVGNVSWTPKTDQLLREELGVADSQVLIAGESAASLALLSEKDNYTKIREGLTKLTWLFSTLLQSNKKVVITGDSLSFNGFGYPVVFGANGGGYATDNPFGLSSWAHIFRDFTFTSHASFLPIERCNLITTAVLSYTNETSAKDYGINAKAVTLMFSTATDKARLSSGYPGSNAIIVSLAPAAQAVTFKVDGVSYDNESPDGHYKGYGYKIIPLPNLGVTANIDTVVKKSDGTAGTLTLYGMGSTDMTIPKLTGKGAWTSGQILAEFSTLVAPYSPDIVYYIIGANDIASGVPIATMADNIKNFISSCRALKPACEIVLISTPPSSSYTRATAKTYIKAMRQVADETNSSIIDLWSEMENIPPSEWRHDNIHFNTQGDTIVFSIIRALTMPGIPTDITKFHPCRESYLGARGTFMLYNGTFKHGSFTVTYRMVSGVPSIIGQYPSGCEGLHKVVYAGPRLKITSLNYFGISSVGLINDGVNKLVPTSIYSLSDWDVALYDASGVAINADGSNNYFYVTYSRQIVG